MYTLYPEQIEILWYLQNICHVFIQLSILVLLSTYKAPCPYLPT